MSFASKYLVLYDWVRNFSFNLKLKITTFYYLTSCYVVTAYHSRGRVTVHKIVESSDWPLVGCPRLQPSSITGDCAVGTGTHLSLTTFLIYLRHLTTADLLEARYMKLAVTRDISSNLTDRKLTCKKEPAGFSASQTPIYQSTRRHNSEDSLLSNI